jgi:nitrogen fixation/metabolism regulation signal transduction histidine kinase
MHSYPDLVSVENVTKIQDGVVELPQLITEGLAMLSKGVEPTALDTQEIRKTVDNDLILNVYQRIRELAPQAEVDPDSIGFNVVATELPQEAKNAIYNLDIFNKVSENVAQNAVKSVLDLEEIPEEGVEITINYNVLSNDGKDMLEVRFSDNGKGLSDPTVERVDFTEGGTKWNKESTGEVKGTGFGMYSLAETTRKLGGDLYLAPRTDGKRGASVVLQIPLAS